MKYILLCFFILLAITMQSQSCEKTIKKCKNPDNTFKISHNSRSIKMRRGKKSRIVLYAYEGREYFFSAYAAKKAGRLQFRIIDASSSKILYDNASCEMTASKSFKNNSTRKLFIELLTPNWMSVNDYECAAFKIAYKKI